jgi:hypothetical protein
MLNFNKGLKMSDLIKEKIKNGEGTIEVEGEVMSAKEFDKLTDPKKNKNDYKEWQAKNVTKVFNKNDYEEITKKSDKLKLKN